MTRISVLRMKQETGVQDWSNLDGSIFKTINLQLVLDFSEGGAD
jgi:hypothetical protein